MSDSIDRAIELHNESARLEQAGDLKGAEALCREALAIFEREDGPESPDVANLLHSLGTILEKSGRYDEAEACARRSIAIIEPLLPLFESQDGLLILIHGLGLLGTALRQKGAYAAAQEPLARAVDLAESLADEPDEVAIALNDLGVLCKFAGWFERGERVYARAVERILPVVGEEHYLMATLYHNIGGLEHARRRYDRAEEPSRRAWKIRRKLLGDTHLATQADAVAYAAVLDGMNRYAESRPIYETALAIYERTLGQEHYEVAAVLHNLSAVEEAEGNLKKAVDLCRRSLDIKRRALGADHPDTALTAMNLAAMLFDQGKAEDALPLCESALATFERTLAADHPHIGRCRDLVQACAVATNNSPHAANS